MAFPHPPGLLPAEVAFLCEMELVTVIPRQRLDRLDLLGGPIDALIPPQRTPLPLWLAVLLKRQRRANIVPPPWLHPDALTEILELETRHFPETLSPAAGGPLRRATRADDGRGFVLTPPFLPDSCTADADGSALPYHWFEAAEMLLDAAADDVVAPDTVRQLLRDVREVRLAKMRRRVEDARGDGVGIRLDGVGAMEVAESRGFLTGVVDGLRRIDASREATRREREDEAREERRYREMEDDDLEVDVDRDGDSQMT